jgi:hypothetical protein
LAVVKVVCKFSRVRSGKRPIQHHIKRLKSMGCMRGKANKKYPFVKAEIKKLWFKVRFMAIHNKKPPLSPCFLSCLSVENLLKLC